jgi:acetoin utilization protein AcuB
MKIVALMTENPVTIHSESTLRQALELMSGWDCHHLPVVDPEGGLVGIITEDDCRTALGLPDLRRARWERSYAAAQVRVGTFMDAEPVVATIDMEADDVARLMLEHRVTCVPILDDGVLVGIVTTSDMLLAFIRMTNYVAA